MTAAYRERAHDPALRRVVRPRRRRACTEPARGGDVLGFRFFALANTRRPVLVILAVVIGLIDHAPVRAAGSFVDRTVSDTRALRGVVACLHGRGIAGGGFGPHHRQPVSRLPDDDVHSLSSSGSVCNVCRAVGGRETGKSRWKSRPMAIANRPSTEFERSARWRRLDPSTSKARKQSL